MAGLEIFDSACRCPWRYRSGKGVDDEHARGEQAADGSRLHHDQRYLLEDIKGGEPT